jgi:hypothetical protein
MDQNVPGSASYGNVEQVTRAQLAMMRERARVRGQHPKQHGCVRARFEVLADIPDRLKVGLFAKPATYTAYIRFSNGGKADDTESDIHGMAIKLTGVTGREIPDGQEAATHDFILADEPVFFVRTADDYAKLMARAEKSLAEGFAWLMERRPEDAPVIRRFVAGHDRASPLATPYWGQVPYAFGAGGSTVCRYSATPHAGNMAAPVPEPRGPHYLREAMVTHLTRDGLEARFDFAVQVHEGATPEVIDNPTVEWAALPWEKVAVITVPPQTFDTPEKQAFGENLSYTPWHAPHEHRPVGQVNEVRRMVYLASQGLRHVTRKVADAEPTGSEM